MRIINYLVLYLCILLCGSPVWAAVSVDAAAASSAPSVGSTKTISLTINAASKLVLIGTGVSSQNRTVSSVVFSGASGCASGTGAAFGSSPVLGIIIHVPVAPRFLAAREPDSGAFARTADRCALDRENDGLATDREDDRGALDRDDESGAMPR